MGRRPRHHGAVVDDEAVEALWAHAAPMLASGPPDPLVLPTGPTWSFEVKWDGVRALALVRSDGSIALRSRTPSDLSERFPAVVAPSVGAGLAGRVAPAIVDGECVSFDAANRPSFPGTMRGGVRVRFMVFDVLVHRGRDVRRDPLSQRRALLSGLDLPTLTGGAWFPSDVFDDGPALLAATREQGLEGVMAKRVDSTYASGMRSPDWVKLPHLSVTDAVVVGWVRSESGGAVASLAVADAAGAFLGTVGSGMTARMSDALLTVLASTARVDPPVHLSDDAHAFLRRAYGDRMAWVDPLLVAEVRHLGHTEGGSLRQPVLRRLRPDLSPADLPGSRR